MNNSITPVKLDSPGYTWFNEIKNKALAVMPAAPVAGSPQERAVTELKKIAALSPECLTQQEVFDMEDWLVLVLPDADLKQWVNSMREDYRDAFGVDAYQRILPGLVPQVNAANTAELQAEARRLQQDLHWQAGIVPWAQAKREKLMTGILRMFIVVLVASLILLLLNLLAGGQGQMQFVAVVAMMMGALGAFVSSLQRLQAADLTTSRAVAAARHARQELGFAVSPLQGTIFALLMVLILLAGIAPPGFVIPEVSWQSRNGSPVTKDLSHATPPQTNDLTRGSVLSPSKSAPAVSNAPPQTPPLLPDREKTPPKKEMPAITGNATNASPSGASGSPTGVKGDGGRICLPFFRLWLCFGSGKDLALLLLWAFLAGFSERLVPDLLTRMAEKGKT